jgi:hypothetical protein
MFIVLRRDNQTDWGGEPWVRLDCESVVVGTGVSFQIHLYVPHNSSLADLQVGERFVLSDPTV